MSTDVTYTCVLDADRGTVEFLSRLLACHRHALGTRAGPRALGPFKQAVPILRWFLEATRPAPLATDDAIGKSTVYTSLHEGIDVLAARAPDPEQALDRDQQAGAGHLNLDGTVVRTGRVATPGPNRAGLWCSGKHKHHGGNIQVLSAPDGWPLWTCGVRPGREHDTTCARAEADLLPALDKAAAENDRPTLTDLGYVNLSPALRHPIKKPAGQELTDEHKAYNQLLRGVHGAAERAHSLLKTAFKALRRVSLDPWRIGAITRAALVLLQFEHGRTT
ncbi:transposase family protein [Nocardiopsis kunsanensis]|uniref:transposase family protein n=1 Tax=Nocardiopsis kunsanensis TaxID=141693 RepID=UPI000594BB5D|nr:transposase family protein [Nocardiopsis kunsanensis]